MRKEQHIQVRYNNNLLHPFPIINGMKKGCVLIPTIFTIFFSMMLTYAPEGIIDEAIFLRYRFKSSLFNFGQL